MSASQPLLARAAFRDVVAYRGEAATCDVDLSDNTNLWGAPPAALRAVHESAAAALSRYPTLYGEEHKTRLAR